ncbi:MAG: hypothetical protein KBF82_07350 [Chitinophagaceae bacterium]|nr:hypothetical protein [Chitinophagaceae bacterium]MBP9103658.1 hypothetical protein [Chitinophagaceae bacterium]
MNRKLNHKIKTEIDIINQLTIYQQNRLVESIQQANEGNIYTNEEVKLKTKEWLKNGKSKNKFD